MVKVRVYPSRVDGVINAPPSKSYTHRAIILAALSEGSSKIVRPLLARDTKATISAVEALGAKVIQGETALIVKGLDVPQTPEDVINAENSGTTIRIMTSVSALTPQGYTVLTGDSSLRSRPMQPLLTALTDLGVKCWSSRLNGKPPIVVQGGGIKGGVVSLRGDISSQFISSLLISTPKAENDTTIKVVGKIVSKPYIDATIFTINQFGGSVANPEIGIYHIKQGQKYTPTEVSVPGDFSSASFILASAALTGGEVEVKSLSTNRPQADRAIIDILKDLGAEVELKRSEEAVRVKGPKGLLKGGIYDLTDSPDLLPVLAVLGLRCKDGIEVRGVAHARYKETDRISVLAEELSKTGALISTYEDGLKIKAGTFKHCILDARGDHRMFMAFCLAGLISSDGCEVIGAESVDVSYPNFIDDMKRIGALMEVK
ncbi:MAG: 3-phosphoshikimate 1-carboxyvinyltransferase [Nitrososphaerales archaeon]